MEGRVVDVLDVFYREAGVGGEAFREEDFRHEESLEFGGVQ